VTVGSSIGLDLLTLEALRHRGARGLAALAHRLPPVGNFAPPWRRNYR